MIVEERKCLLKGLAYTVRSARAEDAAALSEVRLRIDGETEHMDREAGEAYMDAAAFERLILEDRARERNLFLVAETEDGRIVGFSRCEGVYLKRLAHKAEFGVGVLRDYWGYGIGTSLLRESLAWADSDAAGIRKMTLSVLSANAGAIRLYERFGFQVEGVLKRDKLLSDGRFYDTVLMARFRE